MALAACVLLDAARGEEFTFHARSRVERPPGSGRFVPVERTVRLDPKATALIVCDMWDRHWCPSATARVREMAPRMNAALEAARRRGVVVIGELELAARWLKAPVVAFTVITQTAVTELLLIALS